MSNPKSSEEKVNNRRLKPIYDGLDSGQPKKALQEAEKVLKKHPAMPAGRALKALSLIRLERSPEALEVLSDLEKEMDSLSFDDNTYSAMCHAYREAFTPERIPRMYELLCARNPQSEQYLTHLFMAYARVRDYKKQQQVAMNLYKEFQKSTYFFWGVMSVVMQAITDQKLGPTMFYPLAEKMIEKHLEARLTSAKSQITQTLDTEEELKAYLLILEGRGRYEDALKLLEETNTMKILSHVDKKIWHSGLFISPAAATFIFRNLVKYLKILNKYDRIYEECKKRASFMGNDWFLIETYHEALIYKLNQLADNEEKKGLIKTHLSADLYSVMSVEKSNDKYVFPDNIIRTKLLARLDLMNRLIKDAGFRRDDLPKVFDSYLQGCPLEHLKAYCDYCYRSPAGFNDVRNFLLQILNESDQADILKFIEEKVAITKQNGNHNVYNSVLLFFERVKRLFEVHAKLTKEQRWSLINALFMEVQKEQRDLMTGVLVQIVAFLLWDLYANEDDFMAVYHAAVFLAFASTKYSNDPNIKVLSARVYGVLGAADMVQMFTRQLDIKYVQRDTLGYMLFPLAEQYGLFRTAIVYYTGLASMYDQHERETAECLVSAYKNSQYDQIPKIIEFWEKSSDSIYSHAADINNRFVAPPFAVDNLEIAVETLKGDDAPIRWDKLSDNRDLKSIFTIENDEYYDRVKQWKESSFVEMKDLLKFRHLLCRCASLMGKDSTTYETFSKELIELRTHQEYCQKTYVENKPSKLIHAFSSLRFAHFMKAGYTELFDLLFDKAAMLIAFKDSVKERKSQGENGPNELKLLELLPVPDDIFDAISKFLPNLSNESLKPLSIQDVLFNLSEVVSVIMFSIILVKLFELLVCQICGKNPVIAAPKPSKKDKKKKGQKEDIKEEQNEKKGDLVDRFEQMKPVYGEQLAKVDSMLEMLTKFVKSGDYLPIVEENVWKQEPSIIEQLEESRKEVHTKLRDSYMNSIAQLREAISRTQKRFFTRFADLLPGI